MTFKPSLLLHVTHPSQLLAKLEPLLDEFNVSFLFYQPAPESPDTLATDEAGVRRAAELLKTPIVEDPVVTKSDHHHHWEDGMTICHQCYREAIERVASVAEHGGFDFYSSLLFARSAALNREEEEMTGVGTTQFLSLEGKI